MRRFSTLLLAAALAAPVSVAAQQWAPPSADPGQDTPGDVRPKADSGTESNGDLFGRGLEGFMQNMLNEAAPHLDRLSRDLGDTVNSLRPIFGDIGTLMDDAKNYQAPERLENGDILIRRRADAPPPPPVGDSLREMLRPAPEDDPRLNPRPDTQPDAQPDAQPENRAPVLPKPEPGSEIEL